jgi:hypothetical protein
MEPRRTRTLLAVITAAVAGCGGAQPAASPPVEDDVLPNPQGDEAAGPPPTEFGRRQWAVCERLAPRITACAVADLVNATPEERAEADPERTAPIHTRVTMQRCKAAQLSSRQLRVLEVCEREEADCGPLTACLANLEQPAAP